MMTPFVVIWTAIAAATLGLALYRKLISSREDDIVYLGVGEQFHIPQQQALAARLDAIDKWGKTLTVISLVLGLALGAVYLYQVWVEVGTTVRFGP
jgi:hypothetical protein